MKIQIRAITMVGTIIITTWAAAFVAHATEVEARGMSRDGSDYRVMCPDDSYIVGVRVRTGDWIDQAWIICAPWDSKTRKLGEPILIDQAIGTSSGGAYVQSADCAGFQAVQRVAMVYLASDNHYVDNFSIDCASLTPPHERGFPKSVDSHDDPVWDPPPAAQSYCPDDELAVGVHGLADEFIYSIGLTCAPAPGAPPPAVTTEDQVRDKGNVTAPVKPGKKVKNAGGVIH